MIFGREQELQILSAQYEKMLAGHGSVLFLTGEAGLGKTTLVHAWWAGLGSKGAGSKVRGSKVAGSKVQGEEASSLDLGTLDPGPIFLESACSIPIGNVDVGRLEALQPWADVIAQIQEQAPDPECRTQDPEKKLDIKQLAKDSAATWALAVPLVGGAAYATLETTRLVKEQRRLGEKLDLRKLVREAAPAWAWALPFVGDLAHAAAETARLAHIQKQGGTQRNLNAHNQQQVFQQYVNLLTKIAADTPLVIFLDDLHWADTSSCNLLFYLSRQIAEKRILVIGTYRPEDAAAADGGKGHPILSIRNEILRYETGVEHTLGYLDARAITAIIRTRFAAYQPDGTFESWLLKISDGNALFVTQFLKSLCEDGALDEAGRFVGDYSNVPIPATALAVVEERTRRLDEPTRELLTYATAEGEEFTSYVLSRITDRKPLDLLRDLQSGVRQHVIVDRGKGRVFANQSTAIYGFSHALFHKALYNQLIDEQKEYLHRQCYKVLSEEWDQCMQADQYSSTLATKLITHAEHCGQWGAMARIALSAARNSWQTYAEAEARGMIAKCLSAAERCDDRVTRAEALFLQGMISDLHGEFDEARRVSEESAALFESCGGEEQAVESLNQLAWVLYRQGRFEESMVLATAVADRAHAAGLIAGEAASLKIIGTGHDALGNYAQSMALNERSITLLETIGDIHGQAPALNNIALNHYRFGDCALALEIFVRALQLFEAGGGRHGQGTVLGNMGNVYQSLGDYEQSLAYHWRSLEIREAIGDRDGYAMGLGNVGLVLSAQGEYQEALPYFTRCLQLHEATGNPQGQAVALNNIGAAHHGLGHSEQALATLTRSFQLYESLSDRHGQAASGVDIGQLYYERGRLQESREVLERSRVIAQEIGDRELCGFVFAALAQLEEREAEALNGGARHDRLQMALQHISESMQIGEDIHHPQLVASTDIRSRLELLLRSADA
jgi:tetratricopeptide (TPR) repeat protein